MKIQPVCAGIIKELRSAKKPSYKLALRLIKKSSLAGVLSGPQMRHLARGLADGKMTKAEVKRVYERHAAKIKHGRKTITIPGEKTKVGAAAREFMKLTKYTKEQNAVWRKFRSTGSFFSISYSTAPLDSCRTDESGFIVGGRLVCTPIRHTKPDPIYKAGKKWMINRFRVGKETFAIATELL